ncbi:hypothetical protein HNV12_20880 [Methanococcoides sp. SA1]|nr:hypothetical protein [Methanococcoides sp. SA1]
MFEDEYKNIDDDENFVDFEINHQVWEIDDAIERLQELRTSIKSLKVQKKEDFYSYSYVQMVPGDDSSFEEKEEDSRLQMAEFFREKMDEILFGFCSLSELQNIYKDVKIEALKRDFFRSGALRHELMKKIARGEEVDQTPEDIMDSSSYRCYRT